ncbi:MAG: exodeoxyribonuclease VII small subunit [Candidatus Zixiibacteriota bacterium]
MAQKKNKTYEEDLARLTEIVELLEEGPETLDGMLDLYREGTEVAGRLEKMLNEAETKVQKLSRDEDGEPALEDIPEED